MNVDQSAAGAQFQQPQRSRYSQSERSRSGDPSPFIDQNQLAGTVDCEGDRRTLPRVQCLRACSTIIESVGSVEQAL